MKVLILCYDIPHEANALRVYTWRRLKNLKAQLKLTSLWALPNTKQNLNELRNLCKRIRVKGGRAEVLLAEVM